MQNNVCSDYAWGLLSIISPTGGRGANLFRVRGLRLWIWGLGLGVKV